MWYGKTHTHTHTRQHKVPCIFRLLTKNKQAVVASPSSIIRHTIHVAERLRAAASRDDEAGARYTPWHYPLLRPFRFHASLHPMPSSPFVFQVLPNSIAYSSRAIELYMYTRRLFYSICKWNQFGKIVYILFNTGRGFESRCRHTS